MNDEMKKKFSRPTIEVDPDSLSVCCDAKIIHTDICSECGEHTQSHDDYEEDQYNGNEDYEALCEYRLRGRR
jgi:formylmethanofuran dehydrogenase subunit E